MVDLTPTSRWSRTPRRLLLHFTRIALLIAIVLLIRHSHQRALQRLANADAARIPVAEVASLLPGTAVLTDPEGPRGVQLALDNAGVEIGSAVQTSPDSNHIVGFSGPSNVLVVFGADDRIVELRVLDSHDTREHVAQVVADPDFMTSFNGLTWYEAANVSGVDAVSGATLTSLAIAQSVAERLRGGPSRESPQEIVVESLKFPEGITVEDVVTLFPDAADVRRDSAYVPVWHVVDHTGEAAGTILRTAPAADNIIGYQGPTDTLIGFSPEGTVVGIALGASFDNEPYVGYVRDEKYFLALFNGLTLDGLAEMELQEAPVEGVSGATMTSQAMAEGLVAAARQHQRIIEQAALVEAKPVIAFSPRDMGTAAVIMAAILVGCTGLRGKKWVRIPFQLLLIVYLGFINGDLLSLAMFVGWARSGVPVTSALGLVLLTLAAVLLPVTTRRNLYCSHICPHGAAQQLAMRRLPWQFNPSPRLRQMLTAIPAVLLLWVVLVAMLHLPFSLIDIEPFDAWVWRIAGWATISIAIVGLVASLFVPMAYCRYGCPTGAVLGYLRFNAGSDRLTRRDAVAIGLVVVAVLIAFG
jgi:Na+-translocating ferredoxin:NAD+ oxidoreductase RnfG subunit